MFILAALIYPRISTCFTVCLKGLCYHSFRGRGGHQGGRQQRGGQGGNWGRQGGWGQQRGGGGGGRGGQGGGMRGGRQNQNATANAVNLLVGLSNML